MDQLQSTPNQVSRYGFLVTETKLTTIKINDFSFLEM